jgi:hypothetical protein
MVWRSTTRVPLRFPGAKSQSEQLGYLQIAKALLPGSQTKRPVTLAELLLEHLPQEPLERALFLKRFVSQVSGRIVALDEFMNQPRVATLRTRCQRLLVEILPCEVLEGIAERQRLSAHA